MCQCSKKLVTYRECCCFDHSDFPALVSSGTQAQPQVILDLDYLPDYLSISYDWVQPQVILDPDYLPGYLSISYDYYDCLS